MPQPETRDRTPLAVDVRKATPADTAPLVGVLARAFDDDPFTSWFVRQDSRREERLARYMKVGLAKLALPHGLVYTTEGHHGAALWTPPGKWHMGTLQQLLLIPAMGGVTGWRRIPAVMSGIGEVERCHPAAPHYYLLALGTDPVHQGRGVGGSLLRPVLERCDAEGVPAYLESSKERNLPLYERNGFRVTAQLRVPNGGPLLWLMWREPQ